MAQQVADRHRRTAAVVLTTASASSGKRRPVDEDDVGPGLLLGGDVALVAPGRHDDQAVDPPVDEPACELTFARRVLVEARREDEHPRARA